MVSGERSSKPFWPLGTKDVEAIPGPLTLVCLVNLNYGSV